MKWVTDNTGRFPQRPHYLPEEIDLECEQMIASFLQERIESVAFPIRTDDLTVLLEQYVGGLDLYADLSNEEGEVEGVTDFFVKEKPIVRISKVLSEDVSRENRLRTTLTHELGHVTFHRFLFDFDPTPSLFSNAVAATSNKCKREKIVDARPTDWMEWQAGYACGSFLMPLTALKQEIFRFQERTDVGIGKLAVNTRDGQMLIDAVSRTFSVSNDAARVRLLQRNLITADNRTANGSLF